MGAFADTLFSVLLSWVQSAVGSIVTLVQSGGDRGLLAFLGNNWLFIVLVLVAGGLVVDWLIWLLRWQPYHVWATRARRFKRGLLRLFGVGRRDEARLQPDGPDAPLQQTRRMPAVRKEPLELDEEQQRAAFAQAQAVPEEALGAYPGQRYDAQPVYEQQPAYEPEPVYEQQPAYEPESVYEQQPVYQPESVYEQQPVYQPEPAYEQQPVYQPESVYEQQPAYEPEPAYEQQPAYDQPAEEVADMPDDARRDEDLRQRFGRPDAPQQDVEAVPAFDPFAPYDAPEMLTALGMHAGEPASEPASPRPRRRRRGAGESQSKPEPEPAPEPEPRSEVNPAEDIDLITEAPAQAEELPDAPQWPDWENTSAHPVARMADIRVPGTRTKLSMVDRLRERLDNRAQGGPKKRSRLAAFFDPREESVRGLSPRVKKEDAFSHPVRPGDEGRE